MENPTDLLALHRAIFDLLRERKLITTFELKDKIGVTGLKWPMRVLARHLRRLERLGCIKQVRARPDIEAPSPFLFRCIRYVRDPEGQEWNPVIYPSKASRMQSISMASDESDLPSDDEQGYLAEEEQYNARFGNGQQPESLQEVGRSIPQWSGDSTLSNLLYDIAHTAGCRGISTMVGCPEPLKSKSSTDILKELKNRSMGWFLGRPVEHHISRLVEMWQVSQPLHLRHLSIIRDSAMTNGIPHFIHYSYENFKHLVDQGKASWELVMTITKEHTRLKDIAAIEAQPDLDEHGFPEIPLSRFQGRNFDASLADCSRGEDIKSPYLTTYDPRAVQLNGRDWTIQSGDVAQRRSQRRPRGDVPSRRPRRIDDPPNLVVSYNRRRGRERKIQAEGFPHGFNLWSTAEKNKFLKSQFAAKLYKMKKIVEEIEKRVKRGADRFEATASVFFLAMKQYRDSGLEPPWEMMNKVKSDTIAPSLAALAALDQKCSPYGTLKMGCNGSEMMDLKPSSANHSRPLRANEFQFVQRMLKSRIQTILDVPLEESPPTAAFSIIPTTVKRAQTKKSSTTPSNAKRAIVHPKANIKPAHEKKLTRNLPKHAAQLESIAKQYIPSILAHTRPLLLQEDIINDAHPRKRKQAPGNEIFFREPKRPRKKKLSSRNDSCPVGSSTTSPSESSLQSYEQQLENISRPTSGFHIGKEARLWVSGKRRRGRKCLLAVIKSPRIRDLEFLAWQIPTTPGPLALQDGVRPEPADYHVTAVNVAAATATALGQTRPTQSYAQQLEDISRPAIGFYLGQEATLSQVGRRGRPRKSRLAVFKSPLIRGMACLSVGNHVTENPLPHTHPLVQYQQVQRARQPDLTLQRMTSEGPSRAVPAAPQEPDSPEVGPTSELASPVMRSDIVQSWSHTPNAMINTTKNDGWNISDHAARDSIPAMPLISRLSQAQKSTGELYDLNGLINSVVHDEKSSLGSNSQNSLSFTQDGISNQAEESFEVQEPCATGSPVSDIAISSHPSNTPPEDGTGVLGSFNPPCGISNQQPSDVAVDEQVQSPHIRSLRVDGPLWAQNSVSPVSRTENDATIAQPLLQQPRHHETAIFEANAESPQPATTRLDDGTAGDHAAAQRSRESSVTLREDLAPQNIIAARPNQKARNNVKKVTLQGGTIAAQRRKIIMEIVEKCGGVYPGIPELCSPFKEEWQKSGHSGRPETSTLRTAVKALCDKGSLRQLTFNFKDPRGLLIKKDMITKVEISPTDPSVIEIQKAVIAMHPNQYIPEETGASDAARNVMWTPRGRAKMRTVKDLEVDESPVQLGKVPTYVENYEIKYRSRQQRKAEQERRMADLRNLMAVSRLPKIAARSLQRKVDRLESLNQNRYDPEGRAFLPPTDEQAETNLHPTHLSLAMGIPSGRHSQTHYTELFRKQTRKRLEELQQAKESAQRKQSDSGQREKVSKGCGGPQFISWQLEAPASLHKLGPNDASKLRTFQLSNKTLIPRRNSLDSDRHSPEARQQMYTIMEPEHFFHRATGTFAVNFSRWRTVNQICQRYYWRGPQAKSFADHVDDLMIYELTANGSEHATYSNWPFINYTFPHFHWTTHDQESSTQASWFSKNGGSRGYERVTSEHPSRDSTADPYARAPGASGKRKREVGERQRSFKTRRLTTVAKLSQLMKSRELGDALGRSKNRDKSPRKRRKRRERVLTADEIQRILIAVIVIRTLTGGVERHIDWVLVTKVCDPEHDQAYIQRKWPRVLQSHKLLAQQLQANFQELFLRAYKEGLVPPLDYDNLLAYDWAWLVNWTINHIDTPVSGAPDLPLQRDRLDRIFQLSVGDDSNLHAYYEMDTVASIPRRETDLHKKAWVRSLTVPAEGTADTQIETMDIVKTWIRANVATKARTYNPRLARDKLAQFDPELIDRALKEMLSSRVLMAQNKGRPMPGRNFDLSEHYLRPLKKKIEAAKFLQAPIVKRGLDKTLGEKGELIVAELTDDVDMIVMQNMQAHGRISLIAKNPPMQRFGLTDNGSYKVRLMDKRKLHFEVGIRATESYVQGNPLLPLPEPPSLPPNGSQRAKIPLWYDINGEVIPELWQLALAATMSVLVMRPGITARVLEPSVRPTLGLWEVQMILDWVVEAGVARKTDDMYNTEEWWWLCLDNGLNDENEAQGEADMDRNSPDVREGQLEV
ncbi:MAG: hypothetical protein Q9204_002846 [Flavoplaca sp. TL-2023a]